MMKIAETSPYHKEPRKRSKHLSRKEFESILFLDSCGWSQKAIAKEIDRSAATINAALRIKPEDFVDRTPKAVAMSEKVIYNEMKEEDFSKLPDNVYFKHSKEFLL